VKRPAAGRTKLDVVKPPSNVHFLDSIGTRGGSVYVLRLTEALNSGGAVRIVADDHYMRSQLRQASVKLKLKLVYALDGDVLYIKPVAIGEELKRLILWLREPRSVAELEGKKLELHLNNSLQSLAKDGLAHLHKDKWVLTEKGMDAL
jgi:hypothetical protein